MVGEDNEKRLALKIKHREDELSQAKAAHKKQVRMPTQTLRMHIRDAYNVSTCAAGPDATHTLHIWRA